jgi:catechol 2,3-dioxygenase-like lactoylglutathione lyase family enzyme
MAIRRMDHVGIVVDDLAAGIGFFVALGFELQGEGSVGGDWVDRVIGLEGARSDIAMLQTPDGDCRVELTEFQTPPSPASDPAAPANVPGLRHLAIEVDDVDATLAALRPHGAELVGTVERYRDVYRLGYVRGPAGIIVELAEPLQ